MSLSSTHTTASVVAATVAVRGQLYMRANSPNTSPRSFKLTLKFTPWRRCSTCRSQQYHNEHNVKETPTSYYLHTDNAQHWYCEIGDIMIVLVSQNTLHKSLQGSMLPHM